MSPRKQILISSLLPIYLAIVLFTDISLIGFWTDVIFSILLCALVIFLAFRTTTNNTILKGVLKGNSIICTLLVFSFYILHIINPFFSDTLKLRGFYFLPINGKLYNAYFKPVGAHSGGYGNFWITKSPKLFPIIEMQVHWERAVHHDFGSDTFEDSPIDNSELAENYIKELIEQEEAKGN